MKSSSYIQTKKMLTLFFLLSIVSTITKTSSFVPTIRPNERQALIINNRIHKTISVSPTILNGWLDNFLPKYDPEQQQRDEAERRRNFPEQYPACYDMFLDTLPEDDTDTTFRMIRPLLKQTQLEQRPLDLAFDANAMGWTADSFHQHVDGKGAAIVVATTTDGKIVGGYNPKGWASLGGARPSVAAFLFYSKNEIRGTNAANDGDGGGGGGGGDGISIAFQKLQKVGGGGLACANDDPSFGVSFGPDALVIGLQQSSESREKLAQSKLGPYYERGPDDLSSLFQGSSNQLKELKVFVGKYEAGEDIPYSGAVLDMTSG